MQSVQSVCQKLKNQIFLKPGGVIYVCFLVFRQKLCNKVVLHHEKYRLEIAGKFFTMVDVFVHDTALSGLVGKDLIFHMVCDSPGKHTHDFNAGVLMVRQLYLSLSDGRGVVYTSIHAQEQRGKKKYPAGSCVLPKLKII